MTGEPDFSRRYWVYNYSTYYPSGFLGDVAATFDDLDEAKDYEPSYGWCEFHGILDTMTWGDVL